MLGCRSFVFSRHAILQMFARGIEPEDVKEVCSTGSVVENYKDDTPFPSFLVLGLTRGKVLHVVIAKNENTDECIVITTYIPDPSIWDKDFKMRKKK